MRHLFVLAASLVLGTAAATAKEPAFTGKDLFGWCTSDQRTSAAFFECVLFIRGFLSGVYTATSGTGRISNATVILCLPHGVRSDEAAAAFVQAWRSAQRTGSSSAVNLMMTMEADEVLASLLMKAYPCPTR